MAGPERRAFETEGAGGVRLRGWTQGEGPAIVLAHGVTAHRDLVLHGSSHLARAGYKLVSYDARGHGESDAAADRAYDYQTLADDLEAVVAAEGGERPLLVGHSMGAHTVLTAALRDPDRYAGLVLIGPVSRGEVVSERSVAYWDALAAGLDEGGVEGWLGAYEQAGLDPEWRETLLRIARDRISRHQAPEALAEALRALPRSRPYEGLEPLTALQLPALVVASHDRADPGHPYAVAAEISAALPNAELISEPEGESPLAWQGGKLSREIAEFAAAPAVAGRLA